MESSYKWIAELTAVGALIVLAIMLVRATIRHAKESSTEAVAALERQSKRFSDEIEAQRKERERNCERHLDVLDKMSDNLTEMNAELRHRNGRD